MNLNARLHSAVDSYLYENTSNSTRRKIVFINPSFWKTIKICTKSVSITKANTEKLKKFFFQIDVASKEIIFFTIVEESRNVASSWALLALFNIEDFGKKKMKSVGGKGFGGVLFGARSAEFVAQLNILNLILEELINQQNPSSQVTGNLSENCVFGSNIKSTINQSLEFVFTFIEQKFKITLKAKQTVCCPKCGKQTLKTSRCRECKGLLHVPFSCETKSTSQQSLDEEKVAPALGPLLKLTPPINPEIDNLRKSWNLRVKNEPLKPKDIADMLNERNLASDVESDMSRIVSETPSSENADSVDNDPTKLLVLSDDDAEGEVGSTDEIYYESQSGEKFPFTKLDLQGLEPEEWLNDSVINFYMQYLLDNSSDEVKKRVCLFSTYFYQRLLQDFKASKTNNRNCIRPWKQAKDILNHEYLLFPVNEKEHWFLVILKLPPFALIGQKKVVVFVLNSMVDEGATFNETARSLMLYLAVEYKLSFGKKYPAKILNDATDVRISPVPQQENGSDCGLYVLEYFEQFLKVLERGNNITDINFKNWFPYNTIAKKRKFLIDLITSFYQKPVNGHSSGRKLRKRIQPCASNGSPEKKAKNQLKARKHPKSFSRSSSS